jgi:hypothetical protein
LPVVASTADEVEAGGIQQLAEALNLQHEHTIDELLGPVTRSSEQSVIITSSDLVILRQFLIYGLLSSRQMVSHVAENACRTGSFGFALRSPTNKYIRPPGREHCYFRDVDHTAGIEIFLPGISSVKFDKSIHLWVP